MKINVAVLGSVAASLLLSSAAALAKDVDKYNMSVTVRNKVLDQALGKYSQMAEAGAMLATGFTCTSSMSVRESERLLDKNGKNSERVFSSKGDFTLTALGQPQVGGEIPVNFANQDPKVRIDLNENCSYNYSCTDDKGRPDTCSDWIPLSWSCEVPGSSLPRADGQNTQIKCNPPNDDAWFALLAAKPGVNLVVSFLHSKEITVDLTHRATEGHYVNYNCPTNMNQVPIDPALRKIIHVAGGVKTGWTEYNWVDYDFSINGHQTMTKRRDDGYANFDILYCMSNKDEKIDMKLEAEHANRNLGDGEAVIDPNYGTPSATMSYRSSRHFFGRNSQVTVTVAQ